MSTREQGSELARKLRVREYVEFRITKTAWSQNFVEDEDGLGMGKREKEE